MVTREQISERKESIMSTRKERRIKATMGPLIEEVKKYVEDENKIQALGLMGQIKLKVGAHYDRTKKETQVILTFVEKKTQAHVARVKKMAEPKKQSVDVPLAI